MVYVCLEELNKMLLTLKCSKTVVKKGVEYFNVASAFDIETSSFYSDDEKRACMYEWTLGVDNRIIYGRTWDEFETTLQYLSVKLELNDKRRIVVYVHNLGYEFQFICRRFNFTKVFALKERRPIYAITDTGIEFRCSYILSNLSLAKVGEEVGIDKMVGDLDYSLIRGSETSLTPAEIGYCEHDVKIVLAYIKKKIVKDGNITKIPYTNTGYVRQYCKHNCLKKDKGSYVRYRKSMNALNLSSYEYVKLKEGFQGGFTHANSHKVGKVYKNVASYDFTSSYPAVMLSEKFPCSSIEVIDDLTQDMFERSLKYYCCLFTIRFKNLKSKLTHETPMSSYKLLERKNVIDNNGRVWSADIATQTITEQDFFIYQRFYQWDSMEILWFGRYQKDYLPTDFLECILTFYENKTTLKGVEGKEEEYLKSKGMANSCYGMTVTDIFRDENTFVNGTWSKETPLLDDVIEKYNKSKTRFLFYPWGVWVCAYARRNLFTAIEELADDYIYSDTDSVKFQNETKHLQYFDEYNRIITEKISLCLNSRGLDVSRSAPKTIKGVTKPLGVWDREEPYTKFKTLGAKRYMYTHDEELSFTVSGLNKKVVVPYLLQKYKTVDKVFNAFDDGLHIPAKHTGDNTHTYIDTSVSGSFIDYQGHKNTYNEKSFVHLEASDFTMGLSDVYLSFLFGIRQLNE